MKIAHIAPIRHTLLAQKASSIHMTLAHWLDITKYFDYWREFKMRNPKEYVIVDNGYYELGHSLNFSYCLTRAVSIKADCIVLSDGPIKIEELKQAKAAGLQVMAVPTSIEDFHDYMSDPAIDRVGLGSLHVVNMLCERGRGEKFDFRNRYNFLKTELVAGYNRRKIHLLGISDSILEVPLCREYVGSMDTSAAIWRGLNGIDISKSGKYNVSLDIHSELPYNKQTQDNIALLNTLAGVKYE